MRTFRVAVGVSGGVDSAISAWLLRKKGFDVVGVHMTNWDRQEEGTSQCSRTRDEADARYICDKLQIPFHTVNFVQEYWNEVFIGMIENYRRGRTVVPDIQCNRSIKFEHFHNYAINKLGVDYIATGHYASTSRGDFQERSGTHKNKDGVQLLAAVDPLKDQTYFLCTLSQNQLRRALFPLGSITKPQVKLIAIQQGLDKIAKKAESMGICFIGKRKNFEEFMDQYIEPIPGLIISLRNGSILGEHMGIHRFTLGKRLVLRSMSSHLGYFVAKIDPTSNIIYACEGSHDPYLYATEFVIREPEWIDRNPITENRISNLECRIQRTHPPVPSKVRRESQGTLKVVPLLPFRAVAEGQMCAFYNGRECLGGGEVLSVTSTLAGFA